MTEMIQREALYIWYYFSLQLEQIFPYYLAGILIGSFISVFFKEKIEKAMLSLSGNGIVGVFISSLLGIVSPLCMYGTVPVTASLFKSGVREDWLASFMMSSILLNPQLMVYSMALGHKVLAIRVICSALCGIVAGLLVRVFCKRKSFFNFESFSGSQNHDVAPNLFIRYLKTLLRNLKATGFYFFIGLLLSALFQRYVPASLLTKLIGGNEAWGVLMAATLGVPLYACGGGTIPLIQDWLSRGMSIAGATAFMLTGPATKITNLGALKTVLGLKHFLCYLLYVMLFAVLCGTVVNLLFA